MSGILAPELNVKQPIESLTYAYEFGSALLEDELLTSVVSIVATLPGTGSLPLEFSGQEVAGSQVHVRIASGSHGYTYRTQCTVQTNQGNIYALDGRLRVDDGE